MEYALPLMEGGFWSRKDLACTAETESDPQKSRKYFLVDILAAAQTFTIIAVIDAIHSFADRLEPHEITFLQGEVQFPVVTDDAKIALVFGVCHK